MRSIRIIGAVLLAALLAAPATFASSMLASPGKGEPQGLRWRTETITLAVSSSLIQPGPNIKSDSDVIGAIRRSIATWEAAANIDIEIAFSDKQSLSPSGATGDGVSLLTIAQTPENVLLFSRDPDAESAKTRVFYSLRGKQIIEGDIVLNPFQQFSTDGTFGTFDLEATITHEIGHMLGLRHSDVLGATMAASLPRIGLFGSGAVNGRGLSFSDIAAIRDLYDLGAEDAACCSSVTGRLTTTGAKPAKEFTVWAEESNSGRVYAMSETAADGTFRLGGMPAGTYSIFWRRGGTAPSSVGILGSIELGNDENRSLVEKIAFESDERVLGYIGINGRLTNSAVPLERGRSATVLLGGKDLKPGDLAIEFNSPYIAIRPNSIVEQDFGEGISVISLEVFVHEDTPRGLYSIFAASGDSGLSSLVGALNIQ